MEKIKIKDLPELKSYKYKDKASGMYLEIQPDKNGYKFVVSITGGGKAFSHNGADNSWLYLELKEIEFLYKIFKDILE